ncbi:hypothetical protein NDU88_004864 [Pleurodeles waltl]|uniref:Uncharacterized protein n=1 Tax=Pleurodeles waltl TaxID=8319 RepID=A0AAV7MCW6_PLEWA|nr:hypothetical protein NDU88_004864 [Pleurodeles waltl]
MYEGKDHGVDSIAFSVTQGCSVERGVVLEPSRGPMLLLALFALHDSSVPVSVGVFSGAGKAGRVGAAVRCASLVVRPLVADPVTPGRKGEGGEALGDASLLFRALMVVGSVLPLRQLSIRREGGVRRRPGLLPAPGAAVEPLSRRGQGRRTRSLPLQASARDASLHVGVIPHSRPRLRGLP